MRFCYFLGILPRPDIYHNLVVDNAADSAGGGISVFAADPALHWMTIDANTAPKGGGVYVYENSSQGAAAFSNSIIANSPAGGGIWNELPGGLVATSHCDVWNNTGGDYVGCSPDPTDLSADPEYCEIAGRAHWIHETSPCVGSGWGGYDIGRYGVGCFRTPGVIFYDNWSDQTADGWVEEVAGNGFFEVVTGRYNGDAGLPVPGFARATVDTLDARDLTFQVELCPMSPGGTKSLLFRFSRETDPPSAYRVRLDNVQGRLERETPSGTTPLAEFPCPMGVGENFVFLVRAAGAQLEGWYSPGDLSSRIPLFAVLDDDPLLRGSVGMEVDEGASASFDNVLVATVVPTGVAEDRGCAGEAPAAGSALRLAVAPNPFRGSAEIAFTLPRTGPADVAIYNLKGERVRLLAGGVLPAGPHRLAWDGRNESGSPAASGVYFCRVRTGEELQTRKVLLAR
ncbi:MAG: FlgD immunoglobulin-like domain containing protein [Candidatus Eisenbacteria bacterium]